MGDIKDKFLSKLESKGSKKSIENLIVFVIILIATIIFINYIWNGNKKSSNNENRSATLAETTTQVNSTVNNESNDLEKQIEDILKRLDGVDDVNVLITYSETNKVIPMYNEDTQQSTTKEEDTQGRSKNDK